MKELNKTNTVAMVHSVGKIKLPLSRILDLLIIILCHPGEEVDSNSRINDRKKGTNPALFVKSLRDKSVPRKEDGKYLLFTFY